MKFTYNSDYFPPASYIEIRFGAPDESLKVGPLRAFVDLRVFMDGPKQIVEISE